MTDWVAGYRAALGDVQRLLATRNLMTKPIDDLLSDLEGDAFVIEHETANRLQRRRLTAAREAMLPLFAAAGDAP